ncbi:MAG: RusA family crossover junction endodeoxyribonuclease [Fimbriimonadaceae bacterium]|jgi:crossover junction endodeoxyribonuclease RusA
MQLELPYPPSVNHLWRRVGHRTLLSRRGRAYRRQVHNLLVAGRVRPLEGRLAVTVEVHPPDRRRRDLDNLQKGLFDAMQHAGVFLDDSQIDELHILRCECVPGGLVRVCVMPLTATEPEAVAKPEPEVNPHVKQRTCLKCGKFFNSRGAGNRICSPCRRENNRLDLSEAEVQKQRGVKRHNGELLHPSEEC